MALGRFPEAASEIEIALRQNPRYTEAYNNLGYILMRSGDFKSAETMFRQALFYTPNFTQAQKNLATDLRDEAAHAPKAKP